MKSFDYDCLTMEYWRRGDDKEPRRDLREGPIIEKREENEIAEEGK